jgi:hypothetical protein
MVQALLNPDDDEWVNLVGRYILNMAVLEMASREWIATTQGESHHMMHQPLAKRIEFMSARFPPSDSAITTIFECAQRHTVFRNTVAHSPLAITGHADGSFHIQGLLDIPKRGQPALVTIAELKGRVDEIAALANAFLKMVANSLPTCAP